MNGSIKITHSNKMEEHLLFFYGLECPHCIKMEKLLGKLSKEKGYKIGKFEVWHNKKNNTLLEKLDCEPEACGGVPFFLNQETGKTLCGEVTYKEIEDWAKKLP